MLEARVRSTARAHVNRRTGAPQTPAPFFLGLSEVKSLSKFPHMESLDFIIVFLVFLIELVELVSGREGPGRVRTPPKHVPAA